MIGASGWLFKKKISLVSNANKTIHMYLNVSLSPSKIWYRVHCYNSLPTRQSRPIFTALLSECSNNDPRGWSAHDVRPNGRFVILFKKEYTFFKYLIIFNYILIMG